MSTRKQLKKKARQRLKKHYFLLVLVCLLAAFLGSEFQSSLIYVKPVKTGPTAQNITENSELMNALSAIFSGDEDSGRRIAGEMVEKEKEKSDGKNPILGRSRGVLARVVNEINSGSVLVMIALGIHSVGVSGTLAMAVMILCSLVFMFGLWFFLYNMYTVISRRIFLEARCYEKIHLSRFLFLLKAGKWGKVSLTMFVCWGLHFLWSLTIIGGIIKRYSYFLVPYIAAENPDIDPLEAVTLSRTMMKGHKWQCFVFELSYAGWWFLGLLTLGFSSIFYANPYKVSAFSEYYAELRALALERGLTGTELLNDPYLFQKASLDVLSLAYGDVVLGAESISDIPRPRGVKSFLGEWFGISLKDSAEEKEYERKEAALARSRRLSDAAKGISYPSRLFSIPEREWKERLENFHYIRQYSVWNLILLFFIMSVVGWLWEVSLHLISDGEFVKRGVLHEPWLPIYGSGTVLILTLLNKLRKNPLAEFLGTIAVCGLIEYGTAYFLEKLHGGTRWWDYTGYFLNLDGRICAEGLLVFGIGGAAIVYVLAPFLDNCLRKVRLPVRRVLCVVLVTLFLLDQGYSGKVPNTGKGITNVPGAQMETEGVVPEEE